MGDWVKQSDKGVWEAMHKLHEWWGDRVKMHHVESHVDRKRDKQRMKRIPTPIGRLNIDIGRLADEGYTNPQVPETKIYPTDRRARYVPYIATNGGYGEVTGSFRTQILEEVRIQDTRIRADKQQSECTWGRDDNNIDWRQNAENTTSKNTEREAMEQQMGTLQPSHKQTYRADGYNRSSIVLPVRRARRNNRSPRLPMPAPRSSH